MLHSLVDELMCPQAHHHSLMKPLCALLSMRRKSPQHAQVFQLLLSYATSLPRHKSGIQQKEAHSRPSHAPPLLKADLSGQCHQAMCQLNPSVYTCFLSSRRPCRACCASHLPACSGTHACSPPPPDSCYLAISCLTAPPPPPPPWKAPAWLTLSLNILLALNVGTVCGGTSSTSCVLGLRALRAGLCLGWKLPKLHHPRAGNY